MAIFTHCILLSRTNRASRRAPKSRLHFRDQECQNVQIVTRQRVRIGARYLRFR
jgi:hypothetical protein